MKNAAEVKRVSKEDMTVVDLIRYKGGKDRIVLNLSEFKEFINSLPNEIEIVIPKDYNSDEEV